MIKLKLNALSSEEKEIGFKGNETFQDLISRCLIEAGYDDLIFIKEFFVIYVNAEKLEKDLWSHFLVSESDEVLICPVLRGGNFGQVFKSIALVTVAIVAAAVLAPAIGLAAGTIGAGLFTAAVTFGASALLNSLIPPPSVGFDSLGYSGGNAYESSQMYSISSQSNQMKKFGNVPKVYGTHRMYPNLAASPYVQTEVDPMTGSTVQVLYGIYDFGFGPMNISDIRIGDTSIDEYSDVFYRLVDPNKPLVSEGVWDDQLDTSFEFYKGDVSIETFGVAINKNQVDSGVALDDYQVTRNARSNTENLRQEIIIDFINPNGLISYGTNGSTSNRSIELTVLFSKASENVWRSYNDLNYVDSFDAVGSSSPDQFYVGVQISPINLTTPDYFLISSAITQVYGDGTNRSLETYGFEKGTNTVTIKDGMIVGDTLFYNNKLLGIITDIDPYSGLYVTYTLDRPIAETIPVFTVINDAGTRTLSSTREYGTIFLRRVVTGRVIIDRQSTEPVFSSVRFTPKETDSYKVRIIRVRSTSTYDYTVIDELTLSSITTRFDNEPIHTDKRHLFLELKIRATNQLNGAIQELNAICSSVLDVWNGSAWIKEQTNNPAWVFSDLLTGEVNKKAVSKDRLHTATLLEWAEFCDEVPTPPSGESFSMPRFTSNFILDYGTTLQGVLGQVSNAAQASINLIDGKYGVLIDKNKTVPVQVFTPRNSFGFSSSRNYAKTPNALKVKFVDSTADYSLAERLVYDDGFDELTAETFDEIDSFACTNHEQAWRFGRYLMAQNKLRQEKITINVDFEHLVCTRGDYVKLSQDVMKVGGRPARVKTVVGNQITIDDGLETTADPYGYTFRSVSSGIYTSTLTVINSTTFDLDGDLPNVGDLIIIGEVGFITIDCLVKSITPQDELTAQILLVEKADAIYEAESSGTLPSYNPNLSRILDTEFGAPDPVENLTVDENTWECNGSSYRYLIDISWDVPTGVAFDIFEIYVNNGTGYNFEAITKETQYQYQVRENKLGIEHSFKVLAVSVNGNKIELNNAMEVLATPVSKSTPPMDVEALFLNLTGEVLQLDWPQVPQCDIEEYFIRYSPDFGGLWESSIPLARASKTQTVASVQARTGVYLIKCVDFNGNESENATRAVTSIPNLFNLNVIDEIDDSPTFPGTFDLCTFDGAAIKLQEKVSGGPGLTEYYPIGYYYYSAALDLGDIYTARLQSAIMAEGFTEDDMMSSWVTLDSVLFLANSRFSEWDVETQYRGTNEIAFMEDWVTLDSVTTLTEGVPELWSEWRKFTIGDFTFRIAMFRLKLISNKPSVTPRVFNASIKVDMPDRTDVFNNLTSSLSGTDIVFDPPFKGPGLAPVINIGIDDSEFGDYYKITSKTLSGLTITIYDKDDNPVERQFDLSASGYGRKAANTI